MTTITVDFERAEHFKVGDKFNPCAPCIWDVDGRWYLRPEGNPNNDRTFAPSTSIVHSGLQSGRLALNVVGGGRRINLRHGWDPYGKHLWLEEWVYLPADFVIDGWTSIGASVSEKYWKTDTEAHPEYQDFYLALVLWRSDKKLHTGLNHGWVDNDGDGVNDLPSEDWDTIPGVVVPFGEWFKIKTYVYRDFEHGIYKLWLNDVLKCDVRDIRTMGLLPERLADPTVHRAYLSSGISLYTDYVSAPKEIFFDDIMLSNQEIPTPTLPITLPVIGGVTIVVVDAVLVAYYLLKRFKVIE